MTTEEKAQTETLKEVEMEEEQRVEAAPEETPEEETALEAEQTPEPISELPGGEVSSEDEAIAKEKLAEEVKQRLLSCAEDKRCLDTISARLEEMAKRLSVPFDTLLEEVFGLIKGK